MRNAQLLVRQVRQSRVLIDLNQDWHGEHGYHQRLREDLPTLETERQDKRKQEGAELLAWTTLEFTFRRAAPKARAGSRPTRHAQARLSR